MRAPAISRILLVEDDHDAAFLLSRLLKKALPEHALTHIADGSTALHFLATSQAVDLVLLDLKLPKTDGLKVLEWIRTKSETKDLPAIVMTSSDHPKHQQRATELGVDGYLLKYPAVDTLREIIHDALSSRAIKTASAEA